MRTFLRSSFVDADIFSSSDMTLLADTNGVCTTRFRGVERDALKQDMR